MKKSVIVLSENLFFPKVKPKDNKIEIQVPDYVRTWLLNMKSKGLNIVYVSRIEQEKLRKTLSDFDLPMNNTYIIHDDIYPGDLKYVFSLIFDYYSLAKEDAFFAYDVNREMKDKDLNDIKSLEIEIKNID